MTDAADGDESGDVEYVFGCRVRLDPDVSGLRAEPNEFETTLFREAETGANLALFNAETVPEARSKYLGSSIRLRDDGSTTD